MLDRHRIERREDAPDHRIRHRRGLVVQRAVRWIVVETTHVLLAVDPVDADAVQAVQAAST